MSEPALLWSPSKEFTSESNLNRFITWLSVKKNLEFNEYQKLWEWSISDISSFWEFVWEYFDVISYSNYSNPVSGSMPRTKWFKGSSLNYSEHVFRRASPVHPAIIFKSEDADVIKISWEELKEKTGALREFLLQIGVAKGDRVVAWISNIPEAVISFLAVNSLGAIWSSASPDFGISSVIDRFAQIEPKVLITVDGYRYNGKIFDNSEAISELSKRIPSLESTIVIPYLNKQLSSIPVKNGILWPDAIARKGHLEFEVVPFDYPIWVLYSSGTTGLPKAITHSHGGGTS